MNRVRWRPSLWGAALGGVALLAGGCLAPDHWRLFAVEAPVHPPPAVLVERAGDRPVAQDEPGAVAPLPESLDELSLEQTVLLALQRNRDLQVRRYDPVVAGTFEQLERGAYDPELFAELEYARERASVTSSATGERFNVEETDTQVSAGVRQPLPSGTALEATAEQGRSTSNRAPDQQVARLGLSVTQALLQGFGPRVNLASVRQAELDTLASAYELRGFTEALIADVETAYWNYVLAVREIEIFERSLAVARQQRDAIEQQIEVGLLPEIEAAAARAEVALREQALITAESQREERQLRLLRLVGHEFGSGPLPAVGVTSRPELVTRPVTDLAERLALAARSRPDLNEARLRLEQGRLETVVTRNGTLPRLELFLALGTSGYADSFAESIRELGGDSYDLAAGVRLSHLLGNRAAVARDRAARVSREQAAQALANLRDLAQLDLRLAVNQVERTRRQIEATAATRRFQEATLDAEQERFAVGASTALLVAQAQRDLLASEIGEVETIVSHRIALTRLYQAEGSLLERRGLTLDGAPRGAPGGVPQPASVGPADETQ